MKTTTWIILKRAVRLGVATLLADSAATVAFPQTNGGELTAQDIAAKTRAAYAALSSYSDTGTVESEIASQTLTLTFSTRLQRVRCKNVQGLGFADFFDILYLVV